MKNRFSMTALLYSKLYSDAVFFYTLFVCYVRFDIAILYTDCCIHINNRSNRIRMKTQKAATWFGVIFIVIGILGFIPGVTPNGHILGIFHVDAVHNVVHLLSGIIALLCAGSFGAAKTYFKIFGVVYAIVTIIGLVNGVSVLGIFPVNMADNILHLVIAVLALALGFGGSKTEL